MTPREEGRGSKAGAAVSPTRSGALTWRQLLARTFGLRQEPRPEAVRNDRAEMDRPPKPRTIRMGRTTPRLVHLTLAFRQGGWPRFLSEQLLVRAAELSDSSPWPFFRTKTRYPDRTGESPFDRPSLSRTPSNSSQALPESSAGRQAARVPVLFADDSGDIIACGHLPRHRAPRGPPRRATDRPWSKGWPAGVAATRAGRPFDRPPWPACTPAQEENPRAAQLTRRDPCGQGRNPPRSKSISAPVCLRRRPKLARNGNKPACGHPGHLRRLRQ